MALQKLYNKHGFDYTEAYHKIVQIRINIKDKIALIEVGMWVNQTTEQNKEQVIDNKFYTLQNYIDETTSLPINNFDDWFSIAKLDIDNPIKIAYEYLKTEKIYYKDARSV